MPAKKRPQFTYDQLLNALVEQKREQLERTPRELVEQIVAETFNSNSDLQRRLSARRKHQEPDVAAIIDKLYDELPFVGIMIHGYKHPH